MKDTCPHETRLTACLLGDLPPAEAAAVRAHLGACPACRTAAAELAPLLDTLRDALAADADAPLALEPERLAAVLATPPRRKRRVRLYILSPLIGLAATLVIILGTARLLPVFEQGAAPCVTGKLREMEWADATVDSEHPAALLELSADATYALPPAAGEVAKPREPASAAPVPASGGSDSSGVRGRPAQEVAADRYETDDDVVALSRAPQIDMTVACPTLPTTAQPQPVDSALTVKSPVIMRGVVGASGSSDAPAEQPAASASARPRYFKKGAARETGEVAATGERERAEFQARKKEAFDTDDIPVVLLDEDGNVAADSPSLPAEVAVASGGKQLGLVRAEQKRSVRRRETAPADKRLVGCVTIEPTERPLPPPPPPQFNPFVETAGQPLSTFAIDVDTASYTLARQSLLNGTLPEPGHIRTEEVVNAFDYGDRAPDHATFRIFVEGAPAPFGRGTTLVRLGVKGRRFGREEARPAVLTFVVDASGSMGQPDRIGLARQALTELLGNLGPGDRVQLIAFNNYARIVSDPVPPSERLALLAAFNRLQCTGSTHLEEGLRLAYARAAAAFRPGAENRVILLSDGVANLGAGSADDILAQIEEARRQGITLAVFGVGRGAYNDAMLEQLANKGDGVYRFLDSAEEVRRAFVDDLAATLYTVASDVKIQVEWFPAAVARYRQLGYENRALAAEQFRDDAVDAGEVGSGQAVTALYEIERAAVAPRAAADSPLGVVRVRYRPAGGGPVDEISRPILAADLAPSFHAARPAFRVAACAAAFAEKLRRSPHAAGYTFADVADRLRPAALEFTLDTRATELLNLVEAADRLSK